MVDKCPKCASDNLKKTSLVYEEGLSNLATTTLTKGGGAGITSAGIGVGLGLAKGNTTGTYQTELSKRATPPQEQPVKKQPNPMKPGEDAYILGRMLLIPSLLIWLFINGTVFLLTVLILISMMVWGIYRARHLSPSEVGEYNKRLNEADSLNREHEKFHNRNDPYQKWLRSYMCLKCGVIFDPDSK